MFSVSHFSHLRRFVLFLIGLTTLSGQEPVSADSSLTLAVALQRVVEQHPELVAQRFDQEVAAGRIDQAQLRPVPTIGLELENFVGTGALQGIDAMNATLQASQRIERGDKRLKRVALAEHQQSMASQQLTLRRTALLARTTAAYVQALIAQRHLAFSASAVELAQDAVAAAELRVNSGAASPIESARAHASLATTEVEHMRYQSKLEAAHQQLAASWGGDAQSMEPLEGTITLPAALPDASLLRTKLTQSPRLALQAHFIASERANLDLQHALTTTDVTVAGGLRFLRDGQDAAFVAGVSMPLPSRHTNRGNIRSARAALASAEASTTAIELDLRTTFDTAWQELSAAHVAAHALRANVLPLLTEALAHVQSAYDQGQLPFVEVLAVRRELADLHHDILEYESTYATALVQLDALTDPSFSLTQAFLLSQ